MRPGLLVLGICLLMAPLGTRALAQSSPPTVVRWQENDTHSIEFLVQGHVVHATERNGLVVAACLDDSRREMEVLVSVVNGSKERVDVIPPSMSLAVTTIKFQALRYLDPGKVASKRHVPLWAQMLAGAAAGMATKQTTVTGDINATIREPDTAAQERIFNSLVLAQTAKAAEARQIVVTALLPNTIFPGGRISGFVYFARPKHLGSYFPEEAPVGTMTNRPAPMRELGGLLRVPLGGYVFELPFKWDVKM